MEMKLSAIKRIENKARTIPGVISLAQGAPSFSSHRIIQEAAIKAIKSNKADRYSAVSGLLELRELLSLKLSKRGIGYDPNTEIVVTAGAVEALSATLLALTKPKDEVIVLTPAYPTYGRIVDMSRGKMITVPLVEKNKWKLNINLLKKKINKRTKAIILCNPNNPTGSVLSKEELITIANLAKRHKFIIITDDVYEKFYYERGKIFNLSTQKQFKKEIIRIVSLSKDFALPGWRIGFLHSHKENVDKILPIHDNIINCAPVISQYAVLSALKNEKEIVPYYINEYKKRRRLMAHLLEDCRDYLSFVWPKGSYYFFPKIKGVRNTENLCFDILEKAKVAVVPGEEFGHGGEGHIRLCFGKSEEDITEGMRRLIFYFKGRS